MAGSRRYSTAHYFKNTPPNYKSLVYAPAVFWINANKLTLDDASGTLGAGSSGNLVNPGQIVADLPLRWGIGATTSDLVITSGSFGSSVDAHQKLDEWVTDIWGSFQWENIVWVGAETTIQTVSSAICNQSPMACSRRASDGKLYFWAYPETAPADSGSVDAQRFTDSDGNVVYFHPVGTHPLFTHQQKPYRILDIEDVTAADDVYTRFRVNYRYWMPSGQFEAYQYVNETNGESFVADSAGYLWGDNPSDLATPIGYNLSSICSDAQARYGLTRELQLDCDMIWKHSTATAFIHYLIKRYTRPQYRLRVVADLSACDLQPGHIVRFSNDCNLIIPRRDYSAKPGQLAGYASMDWLVDYVSKDLDEETVTFTCEHIVYDPS